MLQRQDKYLLHSCNSRLLYQTCGNGFALGSYGILHSANIFFVAWSSRIMIPATLFVKSPVESWVLREVLPRDPGHPSFSELQQHVLWRVNAWQINKLSLTGLIKCSRCKKKWKKYLIVNGQLHKMSFPWPLDVSPRSSTLTGRKISNRLCLGT